MIGNNLWYRRGLLLMKQLCAGVAIVVIAAGSILFVPHAVQAAEPSAGAVNNWFNASNATALSVDMTIHQSEQGYHFYSLSPFFEGQSYGLYSGIQTDGNLGSGGSVGNLFIFSVWNATQAFPENGATATPFGGEGVGYSLRLPYNWQVGTTYTVRIARENFDASAGGWRWSSTITNKSTGASTKIGEIPAPSGANLLRSGSVFHERYAGSTPICGGSASNLESGGATFTNLTGGTFSGGSSPNNIFASSACSPFIHVYNTTSKAITGFGVTEEYFNNLVSPGSSSEVDDPANPVTPPGQEGAISSDPEPSGSEPTAVTEQQQDDPSAANIAVTAEQQVAGLISDVAVAPESHQSATESINDKSQEKTSFAVKFIVLSVIGVSVLGLLFMIAVRQGLVRSLVQRLTL